MLNREGIKKTTYGAPTQILDNMELQASVGCIVAQSVAADNKLAKAGTPVVIDLSNVQTPVVKGERDVYNFSSYDSAEKTTKYADGKVEITAVGADYTRVIVTENSVEDWVGRQFIVKATALGDEVLRLYDADGEALDVWIEVGEVEQAEAVANAVLLHDVDVSNGAANGTALIFGFVNINRLDADVQAMVTAGVNTVGNVTFIKH